MCLNCYIYILSNVTNVTSSIYTTPEDSENVKKKPRSVGAGLSVIVYRLSGFFISTVGLHYPLVLAGRKAGALSD